MVVTAVGRLRNVHPGAAGLLLLLTALLTACFPLLPHLADDPPPSGASGRVLVTVLAPDVSMNTFAWSPPETLRVTLAKPRSSSTNAPVLRRERAFEAGSSTVEFQRVETGRWMVTAELVDAEGVPIYDGAGEIVVREEETVATQLSLAVIPGRLEIDIDLGDGCIEVGAEGACLSDMAGPGHVKLAPSPDGKAWNHNFEWAPGERTGVAAVNRVPPGDYEFQLVFYKDSRTTGNTLYASHWIPFRMEPNRTTRVDWHPRTGALTVFIEVALPPPAPVDVAASWTDSGVFLTWTASGGASDVSLYNVWRKTSPTEPFQKVHTAPVDGPMAWSDTGVTGEQCGADGDQSLYYVVTAVNEHGLESLRSHAADACAAL